MKVGVSLESARAAKPAVVKVFTPLVGEDVSVGIMRIGDEQFGLKVNLTTQPDASVELPDEVEGVPVAVEVVGTMSKRSS